MSGFAERWPELLEQLGKYRASKACLYLTRLSGVDPVILEQLLVKTLEATDQGEW